MHKIKAKKWNGGAAIYAHLKLDGHFLAIRNNRFWTSRPTDITEQLDGRLREPFQYIPRDTTVYAELHVPGKPASYVKTAIKNGEAMRITCFAWSGCAEDAPLETVRHQLGGLDFAFWKPLEEGWEPDALIREALDQGAEGWMLKDGNLLNWQKLKAVQTVDCVVTGTVEGKGKYLGLVGALTVAVEGVEIANVGGFDDATREEISEDDPIGRVVEVAYQYVGSGGRLRHPRFIRFRDDKLPQDCTKDQLS